MRATFTGFSFNSACFDAMKTPLAGLALSEIAVLDNGKLKPNADIFGDSKFRMSETALGSIDAAILSGEDPAFIALCENIDPKWFDNTANGKELNKKPVSAQCAANAKSKDPVDKIKESINKATTEKEKLEIFNGITKKEEKARLVAENDCCGIFSSLAQVSDVISSVSADCYKLMTGNKKLANLKDFGDLLPEVFDLFVADDVEDPELWSTGKDTQLRGMRKYTTDKPATAAEYKIHPCFNLNAPEFLAKIKTEDKKKEIKDICYEVTRVQNNSSNLHNAFGLTVFFSVIALFL